MLWDVLSGHRKKLESSEVDKGIDEWKGEFESRMGRGWVIWEEGPASGVWVGGR